MTGHQAVPDWQVDGPRPIKNIQNAVNTNLKLENSKWNYICVTQMRRAQESSMRAHLQLNITRLKICYIWCELIQSRQIEIQFKQDAFDTHSKYTHRWYRRSFSYGKGATDLFLFCYEKKTGRWSWLIFTINGKLDSFV